MERDVAKPDLAPRIAGDVRIARFRTSQDGAERWRVSIDGLRHFLTDAATAHRILALAVESCSNPGITYVDAYRRYAAMQPSPEPPACFTAWCERNKQDLEALAQTYASHSMRWRFTILSGAACARLARPLTSLFRTTVIYATWGLAALVVLAYLLYAPVARSGSPWAASLITLAGIFLHELGHITGCVCHGARQQGIGLGLYWIWPAFFADVRGSWVLAPEQRMHVSMGGLYFQSIYVAMLALLAWLADSANAALAMQMSFLLMATTLNPVLKYDGYWILSDFFDITNLHIRIADQLRVMLRTRGYAHIARGRIHLAVGAIAFSVAAVAYLGYLAYVLSKAGIATLNYAVTSWHLTTAGAGPDVAMGWIHTGSAVLELAIIIFALLMLGAQSLRATLRIGGGA